MIEKNTTTGLDELVGMIGSIAALDFSRRLPIKNLNEDDPISIIAYGLNMLSEELEANVVSKGLLEATNKNLEQFAYTVAHDIKAPINSAIGLISLMEMEVTPGNSTLKEYIALLKSLHLRIGEMINGVLAYSKSGLTNIAADDVDLQKICAEIIAEYPVPQKPVISFDTDIPILQYNEVAMRQILNNLISNAVKYNDKAACHINIGCTPHDSFYEISVQDNGPGIQAASLDKVFDLFENFNSQQTDSHGVGLSIVKKIITQTNGTIRVQSAAGQGAKFIFTINKMV